MIGEQNKEEYYDENIYQDYTMYCWLDDYFNNSILV